MENERIVEKRFQHFPGRRDFRPLWKREDRALRRLEGLPVPHSLGWQREAEASGNVYVLRKTYVPGTPLLTASTRDAEDMGRLLASIHARRVVNNDPSTANFVRQPNGQLACITSGSTAANRKRSG